MATKKQEEWKAECLEALEQSKHYFVHHQGKIVVGQVFKNILEVDDFPSDRDNIYPVTEEKMVQAIWYSNSQGIEQVFNTIMRMIEDDVLVPNGIMAAKVAQKLRDQEGEDDDELSLEDELEY